MFENKKIFILGMARSGYHAARILAKRNNQIVLNDKNENQDQNHIKELEDLGVKIVLGDHPDDILDESFDYLIKNPGVKFDHKYLKYANEHNIKVINEIEMAYHLLPKGVKLVAITGTNGKTTTTSLTYEIVRNAFPGRTHLAGNIGFPLCEVIENIKENDYLIMEIGVPQIHDFYDFNPDIGVLTNIFEAHLDMFGTRDYYNENKVRLFQNHTENNIAIINHDNDYQTIYSNLLTAEFVVAVAPLARLIFPAMLASYVVSMLIMLLIGLGYLTLFLLVVVNTASVNSPSIEVDVIVPSSSTLSVKLAEIVSLASFNVMSLPSN